jgi:mono/diheme cytochrome c family protein
VKPRIVLPLLGLILFTLSASTPPSRSLAKPNAMATSPRSNAAAPESQVERGRYLVEEVAECGECHSPRDSSGNLDHSRWLQGAPIWIVPVHPDSDWAERAPALAGFPGYTEEQGEKILEQAIGPNGLPLRQPMHQYHLKHDDAVAIIAYLKTLRAGSSPQ